VVQWKNSKHRAMCVEWEKLATDETEERWKFSNTQFFTV